MSRLVVKNLPKSITESRLRELFSEQGTVTDVQLKYTKDGVFRQFAFVGYANDEQAAAAITHFHRSCIQTNRIVVEPCVALGAEAKPKSWSKYAADSTAFQKANGLLDDGKKDKKKKSDKDDGVPDENKKPTTAVAEKKKNRSKIDELLAAHKDDPQFVEFMKTHAKGKGIWQNDWDGEDKDDDEPEAAKAPADDDNASENDADDAADEADEPEEAEEPEEPVKLADQDISDAEYMKQLMNKKAETAKAPKAETTKTVKTKTAEKSDPSKLPDLLTIKIRNIPFKTKRQDVLTFFKPLKPFSVRLPTKVHGICYVGFKTEADFKKAMLKNRSFWKGKQILLTDFTEKNKTAKEKLDGSASAVPLPANPKWAKQEAGLKGEEDISESGRIFFRNLAYTVCEADLREVFEAYGPLAEVNVPIDAVTRAIKGFGTVTFVMPEHAVRAFSELDGTIFHGRLFHLIPGKAKEDDTIDAEDDSLTFKQRKALKQRKEAGSSHNWNALFMGTDQVASVLAKTFDTSKEHVLDTATGGSGAAVRLALGETELVVEMKAFLERNEVQLDAFDAGATGQKRSGTVMLAKNLPAGTTARELQPLFEKFGPVGRLVLPPSGVTALIEFLEPTEARAAFRKLAYSKFKNLPLYLEWAPERTFRTAATKALEPLPENPFEKTKNEQKEAADKAEQKLKVNAFDDSRRAEHAESQLKAAADAVAARQAEEQELADETPPEEQTTLFLRNLNFGTREPAIRAHFADLGRIHTIQVAMKKDPETQKPSSLGYGFIQFKKRAAAERALQEMQFTTIEGNKVELKRSDRTLQAHAPSNRKTTKATPQTGSKIMVRNIPFQAKQGEIQEIFQAFAEVRTCRLPLKMGLGEETHRGFGFVDFFSEADAKRAFEALCHSTHLYGRRLVLEWAAAEEGVEELRKRTAEHFAGASDAAKRSRKSVFDAGAAIEAAGNRDDGDDDE